MRQTLSIRTFAGTSTRSRASFVGDLLIPGCCCKTSSFACGRELRAREWCGNNEVMSYAERKARREADIAGLKEALAILSA